MIKPMVRHFIFFLIFSTATAFAAQSQVVVYINAGSRTHTGTTQELFIDANGQCHFWLRNVNGPAKDSSVFNISKAQLDSFFSKAEELGFFNLNSTYESNKTDGSGILISLNYGGRKKSVHLRNIDQPVINQLVARLNEILAPQRIRIYYFNPTPVNR